MSCLFEPIHGRFPTHSICDSYPDCVGCSYSDKEKPKTFCDTCGHQYSDICGTCETLEGVPVKYQGKEKPICNTCLSKELCKVVKCSRYKKQFKQTNAERIRNMTDEELAKYIFLILADYACPPYQNMDSCKKKNATFDVCESCWLEWLKQEVSDA